MSDAKERFNMFIENENTDAETIISQAVIYISELEQQNKELREDRDNLMALISECIELDYFKDEAILILSDLIVKHSTK